MADHKTNAEVAGVFRQLADYIDISGDSPFKSRAYRNAADTLVALDEPIASIAADGRLATLPGFGDAIQGKTKDILATGTTKTLEKLRAAIPVGALQILRLPGVGPKTAHLIYSELQVDSIASLQAAITQGRLRDVPGIGPKMETKLLDAIALYQRGM